jgi:phosphatidylglycerophosphate synthase
MSTGSYYMINGITFYRLVAAPLLIFLIFSQQLQWFKWLLAFSFFTDAIDGFLARRYKVVSVMGAKLDSIADDLTVLAGVIALFVYHRDFMDREFIWIIVLLIFFALQVAAALSRYGKLTSFHTYLAKAAAVAQGLFLILAFFLPSPPLTLFYIAVFTTAIELMEETAMVFVLPSWKTDVKGIHGALKIRKETAL